MRRIFRNMRITALNLGLQKAVIANFLRCNDQLLDGYLSG